MLGALDDAPEDASSTIISIGPGGWINVIQSSLWAEQAGDDGVSALVFCIGGPYGHSDAVRARADLTLRLSACVLNHQVPASSSLHAACCRGALGSEA